MLREKEPNGSPWRVNSRVEAPVRHISVDIWTLRRRPASSEPALKSLQSDVPQRELTGEGKWGAGKHPVRERARPRGVSGYGHPMIAPACCQAGWSGDPLTNQLSGLAWQPSVLRDWSRTICLPTRPLACLLSHPPLVVPSCIGAWAAPGVPQRGGGDTGSQRGTGPGRQGTQPTLITHWHRRQIRWQLLRRAEWRGVLPLARAATCGAGGWGRWGLAACPMALAQQQVGDGVGGQLSSIQVSGHPSATDLPSTFRYYGKCLREGLADALQAPSPHISMHLHLSRT